MPFLTEKPILPEVILIHEFDTYPTNLTNILLSIIKPKLIDLSLKKINNDFKTSPPIIKGFDLFGGTAGSNPRRFSELLIKLTQKRYPYINTLDVSDFDTNNIKIIVSRFLTLSSYDHSLIVELFGPEKLIRRYVRRLSYKTSDFKIFITEIPRLGPIDPPFFNKDTTSDINIYTNKKTFGDIHHLKFRVQFFVQGLDSEASTSGVSTRHVQKLTYYKTFFILKNIIKVLDTLHKFVPITIHRHIISRTPLEKPLLCNLDQYVRYINRL
jgi:hypothetical protein